MSYQKIQYVHSSQLYDFLSWCITVWTTDQLRSSTHFEHVNNNQPFVHLSSVTIFNFRVR